MVTFFCWKEIRSQTVKWTVLDNSRVQTYFLNDNLKTFLKTENITTCLNIYTKLI